MTLMGMAASQARFLGLTARKSNVEYQGQQINQQRTALSNESANLYNQMMQLEVPTPPSSSDFYETTYTLDNSKDDYASTDYTIGNVAKTYQKENEYYVTLETKVETRVRTNNSFTLYSTKSETNSNGKTVASIVLLDPATKYERTLTYNEEEADSKSNIVANQIYKAYPSLAGYNECCADKERDVVDEDGKTVVDEDGNPKKEAAEYYFYQDASGNNYFLDDKQLAALLNSDNKDSSYALATTYTYDKPTTTTVKAIIEKSSTGRYSSITVDDKDAPAGLQRTFSISAKQVKNEDAYDDAYNDYIYQKELYEKAISDINSQTEIVQKQDQQLELRLEQLNTERDAISTEMDSVSKVIEDNIEKTFKAFA